MIIEAVGAGAGFAEAVSPDGWVAGVLLACGGASSILAQPTISARLQKNVGEMRVNFMAAPPPDID
jgi:hypothetical protein